MQLEVWANWRFCTALDLPFLLLPFRPASDPSASRTFVRNYFFPQGDREPVRGDALLREMRLAEPMVCLSTSYICQKITRTGFGQCGEMVLEPTARWSGDLGSI